MLGASAVLLAAVALVEVPPPGRELLIVLALGAVLTATYFAIQAQRRWRQALQQAHTFQAQAQALEHALARKRYAQNLLLDGLPIPLILCERDSTLRYANQTALEWFGFREVRGKSLLALTLCYDLYRFFQQGVRRAAQLTCPLTLNFPHERHVMASVWPIMDENGTELFALILLDRTELVRIEQVRRDFVANVSHEFRTPLASIRSLAETIQEDPTMPAETRTRFLTMIVQEVERMARIAEDLLTLSHAESLPPRRELVDLVPLVLQAVQQVQAEAQAHGVQIEAELPERLTLLAQRDQMVQVVLNLLTNAIRYNQPNGHVWVRAFQRAASAMSDSADQSVASDRSEVVLEVQDTGIGIPSEDLPRIFERFYRVDKTRSRETGGTGLGLSIVKHIVEAHGGRVEVESEYRVGSTFRVILPAPPQATPESHG
ncbi:Alkaline phosphatase synthesis sensor protein PhoR [bacterium HR15]|nr:Alkaline phosphatase synthesis sensor protein PhoR [bacterium HR15]